MIESFFLHFCHFHINFRFLFNLIKLFSEWSRFFLEGFVFLGADFPISSLEGLDIPVILFKCLINFSLNFPAHADVNVEPVDCTNPNKNNKNDGDDD